MATRNDKQSIETEKTMNGNKLIKLGGVVAIACAALLAQGCSSRRAEKWVKSQVSDGSKVIAIPGEDYQFLILGEDGEIWHVENNGNPLQYDKKSAIRNAIRIN